jgi:hypothetical protein
MFKSSRFCATGLSVTHHTHTATNFINRKKFILVLLVEMEGDMW